MRNRDEMKRAARLAVLVTGRNVCFCCSSDAPDNSGQNEAAKMNAEIAKEMWDEYKITYQPMERKYATEASNYDTPARREEEAGKASADVNRSFGNARQASERQLAGMGVDPNSAKFRSGTQDVEMRRAAADAGAQTAARRNTENMGWARKQDAISVGKGMPGTASASAANSANIYGSIANSQLQQQQMDSQNTGNAIGGAYAAYKMFKDGGLVDAGPVRRKYASGGVVGNPRMQAILNNTVNTPPTAGGAPNPMVQSGLSAIQGYSGIKKMGEMGQGAGKIIKDPAAAMKGVTDLFTPAASQAEGLAAGADAFGTEGAGALYETLGAGSEQAAMLAAQDAGLEGATALTAESLGASGAAGSTGLAAAIASNPVGWAIGAGLLASQLFKDGGEVEALGDKPNDKETPADTKRETRRDLSKGGKIRGKGTETSDSIPAKTRSGSYILNADTVKMLGAGLSGSKVPVSVSKNEIAVPPELVRVIGKDKLDKLNQAGLNKRYGLADARRTA